MKQRRFRHWKDKLDLTPEQQRAWRSFAKRTYILLGPGVFAELANHRFKYLRALISGGL